MYHKSMNEQENFEQATTPVTKLDNGTIPVQATIVQTTPQPIQAVVPHAPTAITRYATVLDAIQPYIFGTTKGDYLILRIAGIEPEDAIQVLGTNKTYIVGVKNREATYQEILDELPQLTQRFGAEARMLRIAIMDSYMVESAIKVFKDILKGELMKDGAWTFAGKIATLRMPLVAFAEKSSSKLSEVLAQLERKADSLEITQRIKLSINQPDDSGKEMVAPQGGGIVEGTIIE